MSGQPSNKYKQARQLGLLTTIPMILAAGPLVGYFLGHWIDKLLQTPPIFMIIFVGLGFVAAVRETASIVRKAGRE